jgi:hypothetical protein
MKNKILLVSMRNHSLQTNVEDPDIYHFVKLLKFKNTYKYFNLEINVNKSLILHLREILPLLISSGLKSSLFLF